MNTWLEKRREYQAKQRIMEKGFDEIHSPNTDFLQMENQILRHIKLGLSKIKFYDKVTKTVVDEISIDRPFILQVVVLESDIRNANLSKFVNKKLQNTYRGDASSQYLQDEIENIRRYFLVIKSSEEMEEYEYLVTQYCDEKITNTRFFTKYEETFVAKFGRQPSINHRVIDYFLKFGKWDWNHSLISKAIFSDYIYWGSNVKNVDSSQLDLKLSIPDSEMYKNDDGLHQQAIKTYLKKYNNDMDWYKYGVLPRVSIDYTVLAWVDLKTIEPRMWIELIKINNKIPLSIIPQEVLEEFQNDTILDFAEENPKIFNILNRFDLYDIQKHGRVMSIDDAYSLLPLDKQLNPDYYMNLSNSFAIHPLIQELDEVPKYQAYYIDTSVEEIDEDERFWGSRICSRNNYDAEFLYDRLTTEAKIKNIESIIWRNPECVSVDILNEAIKRNIIKNVDALFQGNEELFCKVIDKVPALNLELYLVEWAKSSEKSVSDGYSEYRPLQLTLDNDSHVKDFMVQAGCNFYKKDEYLTVNPKTIGLDAGFVVFTRKQKYYMQIRSTHILLNDSVIMRENLKVINPDNLDFEDYRTEFFETVRENIVSEFQRIADSRNLILTKNSIGKLESLVPQFAIEDYMWKKGLIEYYYNSHVLEVEVENVQAFEKAKEYLRLSNKLVPKSDTQKIKKQKI